MTFTTGIFIGIILGIIIQMYLFPYFDQLFEVFVSKQSEIITRHNLNIQIMSCETLRDYPEINNKNIQEQTNLIGFNCQSLLDEEDEEYYEDDKLNKRRI
jgi:hypothetical protein